MSWTLWRGCWSKRTAGLQQAARGRVLHRVKRKPVRRLTDLVDRHNVGMLEARGRLRFATETRHDVVGIALVSEHAFQRDDAA